MKTRQINVKVPEDVRLWIRHEAAQRGRYPADVITSLVLAEVQRRKARDAGWLHEEAGEVGR